MNHMLHLAIIIFKSFRKIINQLEIQEYHVLKEIMKTKQDSKGKISFLKQLIK